MKKYCLLKIVLVWVLAISPKPAQLFAQSVSLAQSRNEAPLNVQSPNAASLGLYGEVPVSLFTGLPTIEVPLYTLTQHSLSVPISLNYHASGFRPDMHPGWVGNGWNLTAGGAVTRTVRDVPDEYASAVNYKKFYNSQGLELTPGNGKNGFLTTGNKYKNKNLTDIVTLYDIAANNSLNDDTEPDEFSFNFPGYSGKFYLDMNGEWQVLCNKPVKVSRTTNAASTVKIPFEEIDGTGYFHYKFPAALGGFIITTEQGIQYVFGNGDINTIEFGIDFLQQQFDAWIANSWQLKKIIGINGDEIIFNYTRGDLINQLYISVNEQSTNNTGISNGNPSAYTCNSAASYGVRYYTAGMLISPVYLSTIEAAGAKIYFDSDISSELRYKQDLYTIKYDQWYNSQQSITNKAFLPYLETDFQGTFNPNLGGNSYPGNLANLKWRKLNKVRIEYNGVPFKSYRLSYNNNPSERLRLKSVIPLDKYGLDSSPYTFDYYYENLSMPDYLANQSDHWGFFNNVTANYIGGGFNYSTYTNLRNPSAVQDIFLRGTLSKITYPTKGTTEFEYEQHAYAKRVAVVRSQPLETLPTNQTAGGLRIKRVISKSNSIPIQDVETTYLYVSGYNSTANPNNLNSSGVLNSQIAYFMEYERNNMYLGYKFVQRRFTSQPVFPGLNNNHGCHVGYSEVVEKRSDNSYTIYNYTNYDNTPQKHQYLDEAPIGAINPNQTPYEPYSSTEEERGHLTMKRLYTSSDKLVNQQGIEYRALDKSNSFVLAIKAGLTDGTCGSNTSQGYALPDATAYKCYTYSYVPALETVTVFDSQGLNPITTTKNLSYILDRPQGNSRRDYRLLAKQNTTNSKGETLTTTYNYALDFPNNTVGLTDPITQAIADMPSRHMIGIPLETYVQRNGDIIGSTLRTYSYFATNPTSILPYQLFELEAKQPISPLLYTHPSYTSSASNATFNTGSVSSKLTFTDYDTRGNVVGLRKEGNELASYMWGYNSSLPIVQVVNAAPNEIFHSNFEEDKTVTTTAADVAGTWYSPGYLKFEATTSDPNRPSTRKVAHTGRLAGAMYTGYNGEQAHAFSSTLTIPASSSSRRYILSGWVYTNGPAASIWLFPNLPGARTFNGTVNYYDGAGNSSRPDLFPSYASTQETGRWVYLQKEVEVPSDATLLTVRLTNFWNGAGDAAASINGGSVWFDDVRLHPAEAQMVTYTHDPLTGPTSISDPNNQPTYYEYDGLQRLKLVKDREGNVLKHLEYHYQQ